MVLWCVRCLPWRAGWRPRYALNLLLYAYPFLFISTWSVQMLLSYSTFIFSFSLLTCSIFIEAEDENVLDVFHDEDNRDPSMPHFFGLMLVCFSSPLGIFSSWMPLDFSFLSAYRLHFVKRTFYRHLPSSRIWALTLFLCIAVSLSVSLLRALAPCPHFYVSHFPGVSSHSVAFCDH